MFAQSRDCTSAICETSEFRTFRDGDALNEALRRSRISLHPYPDRREESFSELANFPEAPGAG